MNVSKPTDLPDEYGCKICGETKPVDQMVVVHKRRERVYYLRPRCKDCHNKKERGHRRDWKRKYLKRWRSRNAKVVKSYYDNDVARENARINAAARFKKDHEAILIQGRMGRHGLSISLAEAKELLDQYGRCYPTRFGLTPQGLQECERIRGAMRRRGSKRLTALQIRIMVYEDGNYVKPGVQVVPYQNAAERLRRWQESQRKEKAA